MVDGMRYQVLYGFSWSEATTASASAWPRASALLSRARSVVGSRSPASTAGSPDRRRRERPVPAPLIGAAGHAPAAGLNLRRIPVALIPLVVMPDLLHRRVHRHLRGASPCCPATRRTTSTTGWSPTPACRPRPSGRWAPRSPSVGTLRTGSTTGSCCRRPPVGGARRRPAVGRDPHRDPPRHHPGDRHHRRHDLPRRGRWPWCGWPSPRRAWRSWAGCGASGVMYRAKTAVRRRAGADRAVRRPVPVDRHRALDLHGGVAAEGRPVQPDHPHPDPGPSRVRGEQRLG